MRRLVAAALASLLATAMASGAKAEIVYQFSAEADGLYKGPFALLSFAKIDRSRFSPRRDRMSLDLNLQHYGFFGFGCAVQTGKLYYLRSATPPVGSQYDGPFGGAAKQDAAWKTMIPGLMLLEAKPGDGNFERIRAAVNEIRQQQGFILLGVRENTVDPQDSLGQVLECATAAASQAPRPMQLAQKH